MHDQISWTTHAFIKVLKPLVRLGLRMGMKYKQIDLAVRTVLLEEAQLMLTSGIGRSNVSQLSIATGINRKDVTARLEAMASEPPAPPLPPSAMVLTAWMDLVSQDPSMRRLALTSSDETPSFDKLAAQGSRGNVHHRAMLDDLLRLGMATEDRGYVELKSDQFIPANDLQYMLNFLADHTGDHLQAAVHNVLADPPKLLEQAVYADGISQKECERIHQLARKRWAGLHQEMVKEMKLAVARSPEGDQRIKVGIYTWYEGPKSEAQAPQRDTQ
ncbi:DUF6502 family protein [Rhodoferax sp. GW822-FHT02A01]|uniref:DUF6502 family protein n=1 Tax=Rhodoferax sp. GW822-FHT02A01 TaxID=3141537 RepID=UPI00315C92AD